MEEHHIAGAAVSVVKDGKLFFAKGYGYADLEKGIPVDPEQTIFRIGSVGKMFTWTAVMQLVEQGKLDLEADINTYLDFRIPDTYPQPITLKHLLTHTSGFEDRWFGSVVTDANDLLPVREWLVSHMSERVRPPGDMPGTRTTMPSWQATSWREYRDSPTNSTSRNISWTRWAWLHSTAQSPMPARTAPVCIRGIHVCRWRLPGIPRVIRLSRPACRPALTRPASRTWPVS